jgi:hypothetical protein
VHPTCTTNEQRLPSNDLDEDGHLVLPYLRYFGGIYVGNWSESAGIREACSWTTCMLAVTPSKPRERQHHSSNANIIPRTPTPFLKRQHHSSNATNTVAAEYEHRTASRTLKPLHRPRL